MPRVTALFFLLLFALLPFHRTEAQNTSYPFTHLTPADGLASTTVVDIVQDSNGFIWIGSQDGVSRYDGRNFIHYRPNPIDSLSLSSLDAPYLEADNRGGIWVTITDQGVDYYDPVLEGFKKYRSGNGLPQNQRYTEISVDDSSNVWAATDSSIYRLDPVADRFVREDGQEPGSVYRLQSKGNGELIFLHLSTKGDVYIGRRSSSGEYSYEEVSRSLNPSGSHPYRMHVFLDSDGGEWLVNQDQYMKKESPESEWTSYPVNDEICLDNLREALFDPEGNLWVKNTELLCKVDPESGETLQFSHDPGNPATILPSRSGEDSRMFVDRQGILWVAKYTAGISRTDLFGGGFELYSSLNRLPSNDVISVLEASDGTFWVGTRILGNSLVRLNSEGDIVSRYGTNTFSSPDGRTVSSQLSYPYARTLAESSDGSIWAGTGSTTSLSGGLNRIRPGRSSIVRFKHDEDDVSSLPNNRIDDIAVDGSDRVWFLTPEEPLHRIDPNSERFYDLELPSDSLESNRNRQQLLYTDLNGDLWIVKSGHKYPFFLDHESLDLRPVELEFSDGTPLYLQAGDIHSIHQDDAGNYWIGTWRGFGTFNPDSEVISSWYSRDNLNMPVDEISAIQSDESGTIWLSSTDGILRFEPDSEQISHYGFDRGLQGNIFNPTVSQRGESGMIYFGGAGGLNVFNPSQIRPNPFAPDLVFTGLRLDGSEISPDEGRVIEQPLITVDEITIPPSITTITIEFAALHFGSPSRNEYEYTLEGFDNDWKYGGAIGSATYTNLPPGEYNFRLRASNRDGVWSNGDDKIKIIQVLPPWYRTWWAYGFYVILIGVGLFGVDRVQRRRLIQREREKTRERELEQARKIEKAYHDLEKAHNKLEAAHENLKRVQDQLVQQEKLASLGQLTAGIAHEIKNPLNFVNNFSEVSLEMLDEAKEELAKMKEESEAREEVEYNLEEIHKLLSKVNEHGNRANNIVQSMLMHSRSGSSEASPTDLNTLVKEAVNLSFHSMKASENPINIDIKHDLDENVGEVTVIAEDFSRVFVNITNNAFDAIRDKLSEENGYDPELTLRTRKKGGKVVIEVQDNGPGIPEEIQEKILQPFFTTKKGTEGTGLGLSITNDIVKAHGGEITIESEPGFTCFTITIPN
jgi:signal transduction histidine kinase/ligand-binding sensor domain-containing protein